MAAQTPTRPLIAALLRNEPDRVRPLLDQGVDVNATWLDGDEETALMVAAGSNRPDIVELLLDAGADPTIRDAWGRTAAIWAAEIHNYRLARRIWEAQAGKPAAQLTLKDLRQTKLDKIETPLTGSKDYLALYGLKYDQWGAGARFQAMEATDTPDAARKTISDDNDRMRETGPYLICRRADILQQDPDLPTNPMATSIDPFRLTPKQWLVLAHLPTTTASSPGRPVSRDHNPQFRGWAAVTGAFAEGEEPQARRSAENEPGRASLVQLLEVCTCYEGRVETHPALIKEPGRFDVART